MGRDPFSPPRAQRCGHDEMPSLPAARMGSLSDGGKGMDIHMFIGLKSDSKMVFLAPGPGIQADIRVAGAQIRSDRRVTSW